MSEREAPGGDGRAPLDLAKKNLRDILTLSLGHVPGGAAAIVYDEASSLSRLLARAYRDLLPDAAALEFGASTPEEILGRLEELSAGDLVVLVESSSFRLAKFRLRVELFGRGLKVIEHPHLERMREEEIPVYLDALAFDGEYYRRVGPALKERIDRARVIRLLGEDAELTYDTAFEEARLNTGDYRGSRNVGGQFPIGEVFTEPRQIGRVNGTVKLFAFGDLDFTVSAPPAPMTALIEEGLLVEARGSSAAFDAVLGQIRAGEGRVWVRELGFGLNRAMTRERRVSENGAYERMCGIHLSLGAKHAMYAKPAFPKKQTRFHVDVFAAVQRVEIDGETVFERGSYTL